MTLLDVLQNLSLAAMFAVTLAIGLVLSGLVVVAVRFGVQKSGFSPTTILPMRDTLIGAISALFALMVAFSAAGIWNDTSQANTAVQRESNALENMLALAPSLPADLAEKLRTGVSAYTRQVVEKDWPAMIGKAAVDDPVYEAGDAILLGLINMLSVEQSRIAGLPTATTLTGQIVEARNARLARITIAGAGVSAAQWIAMLLIALGAMAAVALCHNHHFGTQVLAISLYALVASAAFFVILAHDRPFVGSLSVSPAPIQHLTTAR